MRLYSRKIIEAEGLTHAWERDVYDRFQADMLSESAPFPCILGVEGLKRDLLRFCFIPSTHSKDMSLLAAFLRAYVESFRHIGRNTSFVAFFPPDEPQETQAVYEQRFWNVLNELRALDEQDWPSDVPTDPDDPLWEFSFHGEPIFVVCNTPSHELRKSRKSHAFMITFQPRWVFEGIHKHSKAGEVLQTKIRQRLIAYDQVPVHPALGWYGEQTNREWRQYFLRDAQNDEPARCPFHQKRRNVHGGKKGSI